MDTKMLLLYLFLCGLASVSGQLGADPPMDIPDPDDADTSVVLTTTAPHTVITGGPAELPVEEETDPTDPTLLATTLATTIDPTVSTPTFPPAPPEVIPDEEDGEISSGPCEKMECNGWSCSENEKGFLQCDCPVEMGKYCEIDYEDGSGSGDVAMPTFGAESGGMKDAMDLDTCDEGANKMKLWLCENANYMLETIGWLKKMGEWRAGCLESEGEESVFSGETCKKTSLVRCKNKAMKRCVTYGNGCVFCRCADAEYSCPRTVFKAWMTEMQAYRKRAAMYKMKTAQCTRIGTTLDECEAEDDGEDGEMADESGDGSGGLF